jgi:hypothetical protein
MTLRPGTAGTFRIHVFADAQDITAFRTQVLDTILVKLFQRRPIIHMKPIGEDLAYVFESLPSNSPLRKLMREYLTFGRKGGRLRNLEVIAPEVLVQSFMLVNRLNCWLQCKICYEDCNHERLDECTDCREKALKTKCNRMGHSGISDALSAFSIGACVYHDHGMATPEHYELWQACQRKWASVIAERHIVFK